MSADRRIVAFLQLAGEEIDLAARVASFAPRQAPFFVQQAAEKGAPALLIRAGVTFGTGHNFSNMANALPPDHPFRDRVKALDKRRSSAATRYRYPANTGHIARPPGPSVLTADIEDVRRFIEDVKLHVLRR